MKFLMLVCGDPSGPEPDREDDLDPQPWVDEMDGRGIRLFGDRLAPAQSATTVRVREGKVMLTDGPFAETAELIGGFDLLECADLDEAIAVAAAHPMARFGQLEVRPL
ncbi:MAG: hypothetical protein KBF43_10615 [Dermatophilaceae bacterium]|nr:hypothetical protein [Dermatophilaceae bacterium]MBP9919027.1 hypothetical protein [Dermatophilaceae bacterium]